MILPNKAHILDVLHDNLVSLANAASVNSPDPIEKKDSAIM